MRRLFLTVVSLFLSLVSCNSTSEQEPESPGWTTLFDGSSVDAWRGYKAEAVPAGWQVQDGALVRAEAGGDLITRAIRQL